MSKDPISLRHRLRVIIFGTDTPAGKAFDIALIISIALSVAVVMLDSVAAIRVRHGGALYLLEWFFTIIFTVEYLLRIYTIGRPKVYVRSFFGVVDLLAILPTYLSLLVPEGRYLVVIRLLRVLRVFRVLKFLEYSSEAALLLTALKASKRKIIVFLLAIMNLVIILGSVMYMIEGETNGFTSIPKSVYWAVVTLTTVGYGDISPKTPLGQALASLVMVMGYAIIAVPTGIVSVELSRAAFEARRTPPCPSCGLEGHDPDARHCKYCGSDL